MDYSRYSLDQLFDVKQNIDSAVYPERYQMILNEISRKQGLADLEIGNPAFSEFKNFNNQPEIGLRNLLLKPPLNSK